MNPAGSSPDLSSRTPLGFILVAKLDKGLPNERCIDVLKIYTYEE